MKLTIVSFIFLSFVLKSAAGFRDSKIICTVDCLLDELALEKWDEEEIECLQGTKAILNGVKNNTLWAAWVWDSMQLPVGVLYGTQYHLGNFDQCLQRPWPSQGIQTQYCLVDVKLNSLKHDEEIDGYGDVEKYISTEHRRRNRPSVLFLGVCLPASCSPDSIAKVSRHIFSNWHVPFKDVTVDPRDCQMEGSRVEKSIGYYVFWFLILAMTSVCILIYCFGNTRDESDTTVSRVITCFCLARNFDALTDVYKDEINVFRGMRSLTCGILIVIHLVFISQSTYINQMDFEQEMTHDPLSKLSVHSDLCVDTFFVMSGLLYFRGLLSSRSYQPLKTLLKRYLRLLLPLYALSMMFSSYVLPHIGSGPAWPKMMRRCAEPCSKSWWRNLLMVTNKVDAEAICSETSWYIHCDFQLTILATVIFMAYHKNKRIGILFFTLTYGFSVASPALWYYWQELPGVLWYDFGESLHIERNKVYNSVYTNFYTRANAYLIGGALGYIMTVYKPEIYRKTISKTISIIGFIIGMILMVSSLYVGAKMFNKEFSVLGTAIIAASDRTVWSIGICLIIVACEYGTLPLVNDFLGSTIFVPISKLTYSVYLWHTIFIYRDTFSFRSPVKFNMLNTIIQSLGYGVVTSCVCYLVWLFVEAPVTNLINLVFDVDRSPKTQNGDLRVKETIQNEARKTDKLL